MPSIAPAAVVKPPMSVALGSGSASGDPADGVTHKRVVMIQVRTLPDQLVGMRLDGEARFAHRVRAGRLGRARMRAALEPGANTLTFALLGRRGTVDTSTLVVVRSPAGAERPFTGSPTPARQPFTRLLPNSVSYGVGLPARPDATAVSLSLAEDPEHPAFSKRIDLGQVFLGQLVDHDITLNDVTAQGPNADPSRPINLRTPALDLDPVYGGGPHDQPGFYTPDGLSFRLGPEGKDLLRDARGEAIIGDPRNDENGLVGAVHLAFQRFHNALMTRALRGADPDGLDPEQKDALFAMVRDRVIGFYQGIVTQQFGRAILGRPISEDEPPIGNAPVEFSAAVFRLGHSLVPDVIVADHQGDRINPTDPALRGAGRTVPLDLLFGPKAQRAAALDDKLSDAMRTLLIPVSPTDPSQGDMIGGNAPNIGRGRIVDGVMHLDLAETNILRGRELKLPSGEEYLAKLRRRAYNPSTDGNTDLFAYILREATPNDRLGRVGADIVDRAIGGLLSADPYRYDNPGRNSRQEIQLFRGATFEKLLHTIGEPGF